MFISNLVDPISTLSECSLFLNSESSSESIPSISVVSSFSFASSFVPKLPSGVVPCNVAWDPFGSLLQLAERDDTDGADDRVDEDEDDDVRIDVTEFVGADVSETVAPGTPPLGQPPGLTVSPRVGTVHAGVSRPRVGREAPGWGGPSWREPPRGGA